MPEPIRLSQAVIQTMHFELIREHGGNHGVRDAGLVESALARPRNKWAYGEHNLVNLAASYGYGLVRNHGFVDGNKRVAFMAMFVFLYQNGLVFVAPEAEAVTMMNEAATGDCTEEKLADWLRARVQQR